MHLLRRPASRPIQRDNTAYSNCSSNSSKESSRKPGDFNNSSSHVISSLASLCSHILIPTIPTHLARVNRRANRVLSFLIIVSILVSPFATFSIGARGGTASVANAEGISGVNVTPPAPQVLTVPDVTDPQLPTISVQMQITPHEVAVGDTFTVTLTATNSAPDGASNLAVTLPLPQGAIRQGSFSPVFTPGKAPGAGNTRGNEPGKGNPPANPPASPDVTATVPESTPAPSSSPTIPGSPGTPGTPVPSVSPSTSPSVSPTPTDDWTWQVPALEGNGGSVTFVATARLSQAPAGDAIIARANITADGIPVPVVSERGALVLGPNRGPASVPFTPGNASTLHSQDGRTHVQVPAEAYTQTLTLQHTYQHSSGEIVPSEVAGRKKGLGTFYLNATDAQGGEVHQFAAPLTVTVGYTLEQLQATGISEDDLTLFWYDDTQPDNGHWVPIETNIDSDTRTATAQVNHFTPFELSDGSSPSAAFIPTLQGWQVGLYQGDVSYQYPIEVPAGPAGMKPSVALSYNSASTDGASGQRPKQQAGWAGKGWSLDTGYVAVNRLPGISGPARYYSMVFDGMSFEVVRGDPTVQNPQDSNPTHWEWRSTNESFAKIKVLSNGSSTSTRGGYAGGYPNNPYARYKWQVWTKNGIRYDFEEDAWQGNSDCGEEASSAENYMETYKWFLTRVEDTHGNRINYSYGRYSQWRDMCSSNWLLRVAGTIDGDVYPTAITWGSNVNTGAADRYKVEFDSSARSMDTQFDQSDGQVSPVPQETRRLDIIKVWSMQSSTWELVRQYNLGYETNSAYYLLSDASIYNSGTGQYNGDTNYPKLTLKQIQRKGKDGTSALPAITFTYGLSRGTAKDPDGDWNRLTVVNNGQGGTATFDYESIGGYLRSTYPASADFFRNNRRVLTKVLTDGRGNSYAWSYNYTWATPAYNSLGTVNGANGPNYYPNSAILYFNKNYYPLQDNAYRLVTKREKQFRGHSYVIEHDPNGNEVEHWFYQGDYGCNPTATGENIYTDSCFQNIRIREALKGKEYKTITHAGNINAAKLSEVNHTFSYTLLSDGGGDERLNGLWRTFTYESQTVNKAWEGAGSSINKTTNYTYETTYGNLTLMEEIAGSVTRRTEHGYGSYIVDGSSYIVDRPRYDNIKDGSNNWLARTVYGYDGSWGEGNPQSTGNLTLERKYYNIPINPPSTTLPTTGYSNDTTYGYDTYGNQTAITTYAGAGVTGTFNGTPNYGIPGGYYTARTTTTTYDSIYHAIPTQVAPTQVGGVTLSDSAGYDWRMGTLTSVTGPNGSTTTVNAEYDVFGRLVKVIKPGDSSTYPTLQAYYYDNELPFRYTVAYRETALSSPNRPISTYYDGLGRKIQTKAESIDGTQSIVTDTKYDGLGQATHQSQPRYVTQAAQDFWLYVAPTDSNIKWTTTSYDALGRALTVQAPDNTVTTMAYLLNTTDGRTVTRTTDAKGHRTERESDMLDRLVAVKEYSGESTPYTLYSTTTYEYNFQDLLTGVADGYGKNSTMVYDSLGRKTGMTDLAMGAWSYTYDVNGNLTSQTDARSQTITFTYDALNRLTSKSWPSYGSNPAESMVYGYDQTGTGYANGYGQRTSTTRCTGVANSTCAGGTQTSFVQWQYDTRDQQTISTYTLNGLTGTRTVSQAYDSAGRVTSITYPTGEVVNYTHDSAWRQTSVCSATYSLCYASNASYTALDQPSSWTVGPSGNNVTQSYTYDSVMQRLTSIQVGSGGSIFNRGYTYDNVGNVATITGSPTINTQTFTYDHRDRLTNWSATGINETYAYDLVGNITSKAGANYSYTFNNILYGHPAGSGGPYAVRNTGYSYDNNGNMTAMPTNSRTLVWNTENQPISITSSGTTETYTYDADGARVKKLRGTTNTHYIGGLSEEDKPTGVGSLVTRSMYTLNGQVVAQRSVASGGISYNTLVYLHSDHLGSVGASTSSTGTSLSSQEYDPWGKVRTGGVTQTKYNYTGQKLDDTGLVFHNARYLDPGLGRFTSPDTIAINPNGPQLQNRYSYVLNNPLGFTDPTGNAPVPPLTGANKDVGSYTHMLAVAYAKMTQIVGGNNTEFNVIKGELEAMRKVLPYSNRAAGDLKYRADTEFARMVCQGCGWDLKNDYRKAYGVETGFLGFGGKDLYFSLGGTSDDDVAFSVFGNILYAFVGMAAGFTQQELFEKAGIFDYLADSKGYNMPDIEAYKMGIKLWEAHKSNPAGLTMAELDAAIRELVRSGKVHTRKSIRLGTNCGDGILAMFTCKK
jgi:RHS repeat-associated protein